jgi:hypothetical protein
MKDIEMHGNFVANQQPIREKLGLYFINSALGINDVALKIGVSPVTISKFFSKGRDMRMKQLSKLIRFLEQNPL